MSLGEQVRKCEFCNKPYIFKVYDSDSQPNCCLNCLKKARANSGGSIDKKFPSS